MGRRASARAPSAWGATRDALAAVHNLVALLRSGSVLYRTIRDLLPELQTSAGALRETFAPYQDRLGMAQTSGSVAASRFEGAQGVDGAAGAAGAYGVAQVDELVRLLEATALADEERDALADRARRLADELEATADLLALLERAAHPAPTEVSVDVVVRGAARTSVSARGRQLPVRFDPPAPECTVHADPHVLGPLLSLMIARLHAVGVQAVVVRGRCDEKRATFEVRPATAQDAIPETTTHILPAVPPTDLVIGRVARDVGATLDLEDRRGRLELPRHVG